VTASVGVGSVNGNTANGSLALTANSTGYYNVANGDAALLSNVGGSYNTATGQAALELNTNCR